jgi:hypothetical protein
MNLPRARILLRNIRLPIEEDVNVDILQAIDPFIQGRATPYELRILFAYTRRRRVLSEAYSAIMRRWRNRYSFPVGRNPYNQRR